MMTPALHDALEQCTLHRLIKAVGDVDHGASLSPVKIVMLRNHTVDNIGWFLKGMGFTRDLNITTDMAGHDQLMPVILDRSSVVYKPGVDIIVVSLLWENFVRAATSADDTISRLKKIFDGIKERSPALIIANTFLSPLVNAWGVISAKQENTDEYKIARVNQWLGIYAGVNPNLFLVDFSQIEARLGTDQARDYRMWYTAQSLLTNRFLKEYAGEIVKIAAALKGRSKKCLVLDADNTLWGGIIGEDEIANIRINPFDYPGNIFYQFQNNVLKLHDKGVLIALCSKNNELDVWEVLDKHPYCLIKRSHLSSWRINWEDKSANLRAIAQELNLGLDSFIFVDDQPMECDLVRNALPEVTVIQVPKDLPAYPSLLFKEGFFDTLAVNAEDKTRSLMYQAQERRNVDNAAFKDPEEFLASLNTILTINRARDIDIPRVAQLTQKTNQFNLTTRRYTQGQIEDMVNDPDYEVWSLSVADRYGDSGLVGVAIIYYQQDHGFFDTFLLSCRVLGRRVEEAFMQHCLDAIKKKGKRVAQAEYKPTAKNAVIKDFLPRLGFKGEKGNDNAHIFLLETYMLPKWDFCSLASPS